MSDKKSKKFLPLGSIVRLKDAKFPVMIIGYTVIPDEDPDKIYDYNATFYPMGTLDTGIVTPFNHKQIEEIIFLGYEDESGKEYRENLRKVDSVFRMSKLVSPEYKPDEGDK